MQKEISKIKICFENLESIIIDGKHIGEFKIENVQREIKRVACNYIMDYLHCDHFSISINRMANNNNKENGLFDNTLSEFERVCKHSDIVSVYLHMNKDNGVENIEQIYVPYGDDEYINCLQNSYINDMGDLFIVIDKDKLSIDECFNIEEINDNDYTDFIWSMYK